MLRVEDANQTYVTLDYRPQFDDAPNVRIYLTNEFNESGYLATRLVLPLGERLQVTAKLGVAHSEYVRSGVGGSRTREFDVGPYASLGLQYQLGRNAALVGAYERYGNTERRWGPKTNGNGFSIKLNVDF